MKTTIELFGDYRDAFVYLFIIAILYCLWMLHKYLEIQRDQKQTEKLFLTKEEREKLMKNQLNQTK